MFRVVEIEADGVLGLECSGKLTKEDFEGMHRWLDAELARGGKPALVIFMGDFEGYEDPSALWADMRIDARHAGELSRVAMVADGGWIRWAATAANPFTGAELRWFPTGDRAAAVAWARVGSADPEEGVIAPG